MALHVLKVHILIYFHVFVLETICNAKTFYLLIKRDLFDREIRRIAVLNIGLWLHKIDKFLLYCYIVPWVPWEPWKPLEPLEP